jgi:hypothetical protein
MAGYSVDRTADTSTGEGEAVGRLEGGSRLHIVVCR